MKFDLNIFNLNLERATTYMDFKKRIDCSSRFRMETNVNDETVKVYTIINNKIKLVAHFKDGELFKEEIKEKEQ